MDFYQWYYDIPTPFNGVVIAASETDAMHKVGEFLTKELGHFNDALVIIRYLNPAADEICILEVM